MRIIGVRLYEGGAIEDSNAGALNLTINDRVLVKNNDRIVLGLIAGAARIDDSGILNDMPLILRKLSNFESENGFRYYPQEDDGFYFCKKNIEELGIPMKLLRVKYLSQENKMIFYYSAEERVDFRDLVKVLAGRFHLRIEMRQINIRDEYKLLGGLGMCGRPCCCNAFMKELAPVSLKAAKPQGINQTSGRLTGSCGRLLCCLSFCSPGFETCNRDYNFNSLPVDAAAEKNDVCGRQDECQGEFFDNPDNPANGK